MSEERLLVTVKRYPTPSKKYDETVCTAGVTEAGEWRRLYPIQFRSLHDHQQYKIFNRIRIRVEDQSSDGRPESRKARQDTLRVEPGRVDWADSHAWLMPTRFDSLRELQGPRTCQVHSPGVQGACPLVGGCRRLAGAPGRGPSARLAVSGDGPRIGGARDRTRATRGASGR